MKSLFTVLMLALPVTTFAEGGVENPIIECSGSIPLVRQGYNAEYKIKIGDQLANGAIGVEVIQTVTGPDMGHLPVRYYADYGRMVGDIDTGIIQVKFNGPRGGTVTITKENSVSFSGLLLLDDETPGEAKISLACTKN